MLYLEERFSIDPKSEINLTSSYPKWDDVFSKTESEIYLKNKLKSTFVLNSRSFLLKKGRR